MKKYFSGLTRNTFLLTLSSLFSDISTEMLYPVLPVFITQVLKDSPAVLGIIEGVATAIQYIIQGFSGWLSDRFQRKKSVALFGFALSAISKPFIGVSTVWQQVLVGRFFDRLGAGTRSAPRDALIAQSVDEKIRGRAFGLEGIGDNLGAFLGPLIAIVLLYALHVNLRSIFFLAFIPGAIAFSMVLLVREKRDVKKEKTVIKFSRSSFPKSYWKYILVTVIFGIGNSSNAFLILQAQNLGISLFITILIYSGFNLVAALTSYPAGNLSDKIGRKKILLLGFIVFAITYLGFGASKNILLIGFLFLLYGIYSGIYRAVGKAYATDGISPQFRATSIGIFSTAVGLSGLVASIVGGQLWVKVGAEATFMYGAVFAILACFSLLFLRENRG